ncbi:MAG: MOSC domain-containing protein [Oscillatoria sp. SIO1A7]|nr:MOSC domain-containing protein [Oscillatoria sp. SIO1A7]
MPSKTTLRRIYIYPIKSASGIPLKSAIVERRGLKYDRRFMVVDSNNSFLTQRQIPNMALIGVKIDCDNLLVSAPNMPSISIPLEPSRPHRITVKIWEDECLAIPLQSEVSSWFSKLLGVSCQLVYMPKETERLAPPKYSNRKELVGFADRFPFLLTNESSLADLNFRLRKNIQMTRFRSNFVVDGAKAFAEDTWNKISINKILFECVKPCPRCKIINIDQNSAKHDPEPLKVLGSYRSQKGGIMFGNNLIAYDFGVVTVGDNVNIIKNNLSGI